MKKISTQQTARMPSIPQYEITRKLGSGLTSQVYEAQSKIHGRVSIKSIQSNFLNSQTGADLIKNQIAILSKLQHKNVLRMIQKIQRNNKVHIVTQFYQGGDLQNYLNKNKKINTKTALQFMRDLIEGCAYLKLNKIIHRDIKPSNIFLSNNRAIIADFGFAVHIQNRKLLNLNAGSPLYMPIQSLALKIFSQKSDVFALGVCLFQMLTGSTPWPARTQKQLVQNMKTPPKFPQQIREEIKKILLQCLDKQAKNRPSLQQLGEKIRQLAESKDVKQNNRFLQNSNKIEHKNYNQQIRQKKCISFALISQIKPNKNDKYVIKNKQNMVSVNKQQKSSKKDKISSNQNAPYQIKKRSLTTNLTKCHSPQNPKNQQLCPQFLHKINPNQFSFLPASLISKFKLILNQYRKILKLENEQLVWEQVSIDDMDDLVKVIQQSQTQIQLCKAIESFVRRLFRLTKNYKEYRNCLSGLEGLYNRVTSLVI